MTKFGSRAAIGGIVTGAIHLRAEKKCQDALFVRKNNPEFAIAAVADGHGSASCPFSDEGAEIAVKIAGEMLETMLADLPAHKDIRLPKLIEAKWKETVREQHAKAGRDFPEKDEPFPYILYGTTLLAAAVAKNFVFALQIGDGNILMIDRDGNARPLLSAEETVGEDTESLCLDNAWVHIRTQIIPHNPDSGTMFLIATDGYAKSFADSSGFLKAGTDFFNLWREEGLTYINENLSDWLRQSSDKGSGDDIAMALLVFEGDAK
ncbi:MAG: protein phosphatase 2C domain-containing protein [Defluviitaleaceae bacterium]|nr:protein phosphatase 2C domain-containing protein [Defluviitaleaceae bacterium]